MPRRSHRPRQALLPSTEKANSTLPGMPPHRSYPELANTNPFTTAAGLAIALTAIWLIRQSGMPGEIASLIPAAQAARTDLISVLHSE